MRFLIKLYPDMICQEEVVEAENFEEALNKLSNGMLSNIGHRKMLVPITKLDVTLLPAEKKLHISYKEAEWIDEE